MHSQMRKNIHAVRVFVKIIIRCAWLYQQHGVRCKVKIIVTSQKWIGIVRSTTNLQLLYVFYCRLYISHISHSQQIFQHGIQHSKCTCSMKWHQHNSICYSNKSQEKEKEDPNGKLHWNSSGWNEMCWIFRGHINWCNTRKILIF